MYIYIHSCEFACLLPFKKGNTNQGLQAGSHPVCRLLPERVGTAGIAAHGRAVPLEHPPAMGECDPWTGIDQENSIPLNNSSFRPFKGDKKKGGCFSFVSSLPKTLGNLMFGVHFTCTTQPSYTVRALAALAALSNIKFAVASALLEASEDQQ